MWEEAAFPSQGNDGAFDAVAFEPGDFNVGGGWAASGDASSTWTVPAQAAGEWATA